ncbi:MAG: hypothetical protein P8X95_13395 [Anaerolineales bacterium]|jgi:hypothetical protein
MRTQRITIEYLLFALAFLLAVGIRFVHLGAAPLSDFEAKWALQALAVSRGSDVSLGPQPGYVLLTGLIFFLSSGSNAAARFWPALAGSLLVILPLLFRRSLGSRAALVMAFGLALDPGLVALSRLAGGPMFALGFGLLALGLWFAGQPVIAGILGGVALLGGPAIVQGGVALGFSWAIVKMIFESRAPEEGEYGGVNSSGRSVAELRGPLLAGGLAILLVGTLCFRYPDGLGALAASLPAYLNGWLVSSQVPALRLLAAIVLYQPLGLLFAGFAAVRGWFQGDRLSQGLSIWALVAIALALLYPGRQVGDVAWALVPIWALASKELARQLQVFDWEKFPALGQAILVIILLVLAWLNLAGLSLPGTDLQVYRLRWAVIGGVIALVLITTGLIALGWSFSIAQRGLTWGLGITLGLYVLAGLWGVAQLHPSAVQNLWMPTPVTQEDDLLMSTLADLAEYRTGRRDTLDLVVAAPSPSLRWILRNWNEVSFVDQLAPGELPSALITSGEDIAPKFSAAYRGQDFAISAYPAWQGALPDAWSDWLVFRRAPASTEQIILWGRGDIFPGGTLATLDDQGNSSDAASSDDSEVPSDGSFK